MTLSQEQLEWLQSKLDFGTLAEMLRAARDKFPDTDIVPTILLAGRTGAERVTVLNLEVVSVDAERNLLLVKGAVPGPNGTVLLVRDSVKA